MGDVLLNGRRALDWEVPAAERGQACERERELELLAGLLPGPGGDPPERVPRPVTDISWEYG